MALLEIIAERIPVAEIPELIIRYLAGDVCLNFCIPTLEKVFTKKYIPSHWTFLTDMSYLDPDCTIEHTFSWDTDFYFRQFLVQNGRIQKTFYLTSKIRLASSTQRLDADGRLHHDSLPAVEWCDGRKEWWYHGKYMGDKNDT